MTFLINVPPVSDTIMMGDSPPIEVETGLPPINMDAVQQQMNNLQAALNAPNDHREERERLRPLATDEDVFPDRQDTIDDFRDLQTAFGQTRQQRQRDINFRRRERVTRSTVPVTHQDFARVYNRMQEQVTAARFDDRGMPGTRTEKIMRRFPSNGNKSVKACADLLTEYFTLTPEAKWFLYKDYHDQRFTYNGNISKQMIDRTPYAGQARAPKANLVFTVSVDVRPEMPVEERVSLLRLWLFYTTKGLMTILPVDAYHKVMMEATMDDIARGGTISFYFTLTTLLEQIIRILSVHYDTEEDFWEQYELEKEFFTRLFPRIENIKKIEIFTVQTLKETTVLGGAFFPFKLKEEFTHLLPILEKYQIYNCITSSHLDKNCFINVCEQSNIFTEEEIQSLISKIKGQVVTLTTIKRLTVEYQFSYTLHYYCNEERMVCEKKGTHERTIHLALWKHNVFPHFFTYEQTTICKNQLNNSERRTSAPFYSLQLVNELFKRNAFDEIGKEDLAETETGIGAMFESNFPAFIDPKDSQLCVSKHSEQNTNTIFFADIECFTEGFHVPYCISFCGEDLVTKSFYGEDCIESFLNIMCLEKKPLVYFHNLAYDGRFLVQFGVESMIEKGAKIYQLIVPRRGKRIIFKDSLAMIQAPLRDFQQMFQITDDGEKEIYPYNYYNPLTCYEGDITQVGDTETPRWNNVQKDHFRANLVKLELLNNDKFNAKKYCIFYCERDVQILAKGFKKFRQMTIENIGIDPVSSVTLSSLSFKLLSSKVLSEANIFEYKGVLRDWLRKAIIGGRNMTRRNEKFHIQQQLMDFDACSLYPSAMKRLHLPTGTPKIWSSSENPLQYLMKEHELKPEGGRYISAFVCEIEITSIGRTRDFPLILHKRKGINCYVNEPGTMIVDHIYLEDLIEFQGIEYTMKHCLYWEGERENILGGYIENLYNTRVLMKKDGSSNQLIYKLIMNTAYGKTIQKPIIDKSHFFKNKEGMEIFWQRNYSRVLYGVKYSDKARMIKTQLQTDDFYVPSIIGILTLSMSKRIMNEVMCLAEDNGADIYYQDTDSIHIKTIDIPHIQTAFANRYQRELIGTNMGQFHSDFPPLNKSPTHSIEAFFLGKKAYIDRLENERGEETYHYRLKGIPQKTISAHLSEGENVMDLYEKMYSGEAIKFDLLKAGPHFNLGKNMTIETRKNFTRTIKF